MTHNDAQCRLMTSAISNDDFCWDRAFAKPKADVRLWSKLLSITDCPQLVIEN